MHITSPLRHVRGRNFCTADLSWSRVAWTPLWRRPNSAHLIPENSELENILGEDRVEDASSILPAWLVLSRSCVRCFLAVSFRSLVSAPSRAYVSARAGARLRLRPRPASGACASATCAKSPSRGLAPARSVREAVYAGREGVARVRQTGCRLFTVVLAIRATGDTFHPTHGMSTPVEVFALH